MSVSGAIIAGPPALQWGRLAMRGVLIPGPDSLINVRIGFARGVLAGIIEANVARIWINETTASLRRVPFRLYDLSGQPLAGSAPSNSEILISKDGASYATSTGTITELAGGDYYYECASGEVDTEGFLLLKILRAGAMPGPRPVVSVEKRTEDRQAAYVHDTGRTFRGLMVRLEAFLSGRATTLIGSTASFYRADGTTVSFTAPQDTTTGNRTAADVSNLP